ncbi:MAG: hypothetical protein Kow00124_06870 [Anaerolineae bacterium]
MLIALLGGCTSSPAPGVLPGGEVPPGSAGSLPTPLPTIHLSVELFPEVLSGSEAVDGAVPLLTPTPYPASGVFSIGQSHEGRDIQVLQFGSGERLLVLVGAIHGGYEANTAALAEQLAQHFRQTPGEVLPNIRLMIIPVANPDGLARGTDLQARFNAQGVDLNRNWGCEWADTAYLRDREVDPGPRPFSEPETRALRTFFLATEPDAVIFYHSKANGVFPGACGGREPSIWLGELLEEATGYPHGEFSYYAVTGDATNWLAERGIPAAVVELATADDPEFSRNLAGVMALQCYFARQDLAGGASVPGLQRAVRRLCP